MKVELRLVEKMHLVVSTGQFEIQMDATPPFGDSRFPSPKEVLLSSMAGCTAMDIIGLLKKYKQNFTSLRMGVEADVQKEHPQIFKGATMSYFVEGDVDSAKLNEAIHLSLSKYCSVNAMVSKVVDIQWKAFINGNSVGEGQAEFKIV
jgi:putative redox protein